MDNEFIIKSLLAEFQHCESLDLITAAEDERKGQEDFFKCVDSAYGQMDIDKLISDYGIETITDKYPEFGEICQQHLKDVEEDTDIGDRDRTKEKKETEEEAEEVIESPEEEAEPVSLRDDVEKRLVEGEHTGENSFNNQVREDKYVKELMEDQPPGDGAGPVPTPVFGPFKGGRETVDVGYHGQASGNQILIRNGSKRKTFTLLGDGTIAINGKKFPIHKTEDGSVFAGWRGVPSVGGKIQIAGATLSLSSDKKTATGLWPAFPNQAVEVFPSASREGKYISNLLDGPAAETPYSHEETGTADETEGAPFFSGAAAFAGPGAKTGSDAKTQTQTADKTEKAGSSSNTIYTGHSRQSRDAEAWEARKREEEKRQGFGGGSTREKTAGAGRGGAYTGKGGSRSSSAFSFYTKQTVENKVMAQGMRGTLQEQGKLMRSAFARKDMAKARDIKLSNDDAAFLSKNYYQILHINSTNIAGNRNNASLKSRYVSKKAKEELKEAEKELSKYGLSKNYLALTEKLAKGELYGEEKRAAEKYLKAEEKANEEVIKNGFFNSKNRGKLETGGFVASLKLLADEKGYAVPKTEKELEAKIKRMRASKDGLSPEDEQLLRSMFALSKGEKKAKKAMKITRTLTGGATGAVSSATNTTLRKSRQYGSTNATAQGLSMVLAPVLSAAGLVRTALRTGRKAKAATKKTIRTLEQAQRTAKATGKAAKTATVATMKAAQKIARQGPRKTAKAIVKNVAKAKRRFTAQKVRRVAVKTAKQAVKLIFRIIKTIINIILTLGLPALIVIAIVAMLIYMVEAAITRKSDFEYNPGEQQTSDVIQGYVDVLTECTNKFNEELEKRYGNGNGSTSASAQEILSFCEQVNDLVKKSDAMGFTWEYHNGTIKKSKAKPGQQRFKTTSYEKALENFQNGKQSNVNCSMLPTWALRNAGILSDNEGVCNSHPPGAAHSRINWGDTAVEQVKKCAQVNEYGGQYTVKELVERGEVTPGDIIGYDKYQHLNIYAGDENFYDSGSAFTTPVKVDAGASWAMVHEGYLFKKGMFGRKPSFYNSSVAWVIHFDGSSGTPGTGGTGIAASSGAATDATGYATRSDPADGFPEIAAGTTVPISPAWGISSGTWANWEHSWNWWAGLDRGNPRINRTSNQYKLYQYINSNGHTVSKATDASLPLKGAFAVIDQKYYLVAATEFWGDIGDIFQVQFSNGKTINCVQADAKNYVETGYKQGEPYGLYGGHLGSGRDLVEFFFFGRDGSPPTDISPGINAQSGLGTPVSVKNCGNFMNGASASGSSGTPRSTDASIVFVQDVNQGIYRTLLGEKYMPTVGTPTPAKSKEEQIAQVIESGDDYVENPIDATKNIYMFKDTTDKFPYGISPTPIPKKEKKAESEARKKGKKLAKFEFYNNNQEIISMVEAMLNYNVSNSTSLAYIIYNDGASADNGDTSGVDSADKIHKQNTDMISEDEARLVQWLKLYDLDLTEYTQGGYESLVDNLLVALFDSSHLVTETKVITYHDKGMTYEQPARDAEGNIMIDADGDTVMETVTVPCPGHASTSAAVISIYFDDLFNLDQWWNDNIYKVDNFKKLNKNYDKKMMKTSLKSGFQFIVKPKVERHLNESCQMSSDSMNAGVFTSVEITDKQSKENRQKIFDFLISECDLSPEQAIGILANMAKESHFNPQIVEKATGQGYGLIQWSFGRRTDLVQWCGRHGYAYDSLEGQLQYLKANELRNGKGWSNGTISKFRKIQDAEYAAEYFVRYNEQPGNIEKEVGERRATAAKYWKALTTYGSNWSDMCS